jgi:hypothetical protein
VPDPIPPAISINRGDTCLLRAFRDGRIEWLEPDATASSMHHSHIDPAAVTALIEELRTNQLLGGSWTGDIYHGPGSNPTIVSIRDGEQVIVDARSWHEQFESDPRLAVTATGVAPLNGESREQVLERQPSRYRDFRKRWDYVLGRVRSLVPIQEDRR